MYHIFDSILSLYKIVKPKKMRKWATSDQKVFQNSIRQTHILIIKILVWILPTTFKVLLGVEYLVSFKNVR